MKIGIGYDIHKLCKGRDLILGGVKIPHTKGLQGHSDADVLLHAVCDAILGAIGEGDIGAHFPDDDPKYKDISSILLLKDVMKMAVFKGYRIENIDTILIAEKPKITPFRDAIRERMAQALEINKSKINIKATTNEGVGATGNEEAIAAQAVVLIKEE